MNPKRVLADFSLLLVAFIWGSTFVVVKEAVAHLSTFWFLAIRFWLALAVLLSIYYRQVTAALKVRGTLAGAALVGLFLATAYSLQTIGLTVTTPSKTAFVTGLYVVIVPILQTTLLRRPPGFNPVAGAVVAALGMGLLTLEGSLVPSAGDLLVLGGAFGFACHIAAVGHYTSRQDPYALATLQVGVAAAVFTVLALAFEPRPTHIAGSVWVAVVVTGVLATALAVVLQNVVQRLTPPTHAAILLAMEPVFAALTSFFYLGEVLSNRALTGAGLMLAGMLLAEVRPRQETHHPAAKAG
ncbi:MAG: DMT family transporter [Bacillota bacterium]